jgi:hypothetical protein
VKGTPPEHYWVRVKTNDELLFIGTFMVGVVPRLINTPTHKPSWIL